MILYKTAMTLVVSGVVYKKKIIIIRVYLKTAYLVKIENFLLKV